MQTFDIRVVVRDGINPPAVLEQLIDEGAYGVALLESDGFGHTLVPHTDPTWDIPLGEDDPRYGEVVDALFTGEVKS